MLCFDFCSLAPPPPNWGPIIRCHRWPDPVGSRLFGLCPAWPPLSPLPCPRPCLRGGSAVLLERWALITGVQPPLCHRALLFHLWNTWFQLVKPWCEPVTLFFPSSLQQLLKDLISVSGTWGGGKCSCWEFKLSFFITLCKLYEPLNWINIQSHLLLHAKAFHQIVIRTSTSSVNYKLCKLLWERMRHLQFGQVVKHFCWNVRRYFFQNLIWKTRIYFTENLHHNYYAVFLVTSSQHRFNVCCCYSAVPVHVTAYWLQTYQEILFCKEKC